MSQKELIIDTGFFIALLSSGDQYHKNVLNLRKKVDKRKWVTTWPVLTEVCHLLSSRGNDHIIHYVLQMHEKGGYDLFPISVIHIPRIVELLEKYKKLPMDLADASLVILAEELGHGDIVSTDIRDFNSYRWKNHQPFHNLLNVGFK